jgi:hypothetical protein
MKKQSMRVVKTILRSKFIRVTATMLIVAQLATAQTKAVAVREPLENAAVVTHIGNPEGSILFQVQYDNLSGEKFALIIKDNDGTVLFQDVYSGKKFDKKFQLPKEDAGKLQFIIKGQKSSHAQTFEVNTNTRMVEEVIVKRVG